MGAWGTAIFSDDMASDVREEYRDLLREGYEGSEVVAALIDEYAEIIADPEEAAPFWLALAATQSKLGRLEEDVRQKALQVIDSGEDLKRWEGLGASRSDLRKRQGVLATLRTQLEGPHRSPVRVPLRRVERTTFDADDVFSYRLQSGQLVLFRVDELSTTPRRVLPMVTLLSWRGRKVPAREQLGRLAPKLRDGLDGEFVEPASYMLSRGGNSLDHWSAPALMDT